MTRNTKAKIIDELSAEFKASNAVVVCDYKGLSVKQLEALRKKARENNAKVQVIKNTLAKIALKDAGYEAELKDTNIFVWGEDQIAVCKTATKFAEEQKEKFTVKSGFMDGKQVGANIVDQFAKLPSREELIGMLLSVWTAPARNFVTGLDNLKKKLEENA